MRARSDRPPAPLLGAMAGLVALTEVLGSIGKAHISTAEKKFLRRRAVESSAGCHGPVAFDVIQQYECILHAAAVVVGHSVGLGELRAELLRAGRRDLARSWASLVVARRVLAHPPLHLGSDIREALSASRPGAQSSMSGAVACSSSDAMVESCAGSVPGSDPLCSETDSNVLVESGDDCEVKVLRRSRSGFCSDTRDIAKHALALAELAVRGLDVLANTELEAPLLRHEAVAFSLCDDDGSGAEDPPVSCLTGDPAASAASHHVQCEEGMSASALGGPPSPGCGSVVSHEFLVEGAAAFSLCGDDGSSAEDPLVSCKTGDLSASEASHHGQCEEGGTASVLAVSPSHGGDSVLSCECLDVGAVAFFLCGDDGSGAEAPPVSWKTGDLAASGASHHGQCDEGLSASVLALSPPTGCGSGVSHVVLDEGAVAFGLCDDDGSGAEDPLVSCLTGDPAASGASHHGLCEESGSASFLGVPPSPGCGSVFSEPFVEGDSATSCTLLLQLKEGIVDKVAGLGLASSCCGSVFVGVGHGAEVPPVSCLTGDPAASFVGDVLGGVVAEAVVVKAASARKKPNSAARRRRQCTALQCLEGQAVVGVEPTDLVDLAVSLKIQFVAELGALSSYADVVRGRLRRPEPLAVLSLARSMVLQAVRGCPAGSRPVDTSASRLQAVAVLVMREAMSEEEAWRTLLAFRDSLDWGICEAA
jgi:hypothetical protein